jgi:hypothetical protein
VDRCGTGIGASRNLLVLETRDNLVEQAQGAEMVTATPEERCRPNCLPATAIGARGEGGRSGSLQKTLDKIAAGSRLRSRSTVPARDGTPVIALYDLPK